MEQNGGYHPLEESRQEWVEVHRSEQDGVVALQ